MRFSVRVRTGRGSAGATAGIMVVAGPRADQDDVAHRKRTTTVLDSRRVRRTLAVASAAVALASASGCPAEQQNGEDQQQEQQDDGDRGNQGEEQDQGDDGDRNGDDGDDEDDDSED